jgi:hypothetical protein
VLDPAEVEASCGSEEPKRSSKYLPENDRSSFILPFPPGASSFQWLSLRRLWGAHASRASRVLNFARA